MDLKNAINKSEENNRKVVLFFFAALLITGLFIFSDFGISWDEQYQWKNNGQVNYDFITNGNKDALLNGADKYHGPAFELLLTGAEKIFDLTDTRTIFLMRHLLTFLTFYLSAVFFYFLALKIFKNRKIALAGFLFYVLSPHIFSHAFYNSKDPVFLAFFTISIYYLFWFLENKTFFRAVIFALVTAFTIDIRVIGVLIPVFFIYLICIEAIRAKRLKTNTGKNKLFPLVFFFLILAGGIVLFWPVLWLDPLYHFKEALKENSRFPFDAPVLYFGEQYTPTTLPWHYLFFWMFVSRPLIYSLLLVVGVITICKHFAVKPLTFILEHTHEQIVIFWFFLPLMAMLVFGSPAFDTGRHLYFMHGAFVLLSLYGLKEAWMFAKRKKALIFAFGGLVFLSFAGVIFKMAVLHPYEHIYMNETQGNNLLQQKNNFEFDYWGLAQRDVLEQLLKKDPSAHITVWAENLPGQINTYLLKPEERARIHSEKNLVNAQYFLADYRWNVAGDYPYSDSDEVCSTMIGNAKAATIFKITAKPQ